MPSRTAQWLTLLGLTFGVLAFAPTVVALLPRTPGQVSYYALLFGAWLPRFGALAGLGILLGIPGVLYQQRRLRRIALISVALATPCAWISAWISFDTLLTARSYHLQLAVRGALLGPRLDGVGVQTVTYSPPLQADLYRAHDLPPNAPAVVVVHGGAWRHGDKSEIASWSRWLAAQGYLVLDIQYRLAGPATWREGVEDIQRAMTWLRHADLGVDPERISLFGRSAGGHLALLAAYASDATHAPQSVIAFYAPTDLTRFYAEMPEVREELEALIGGAPPADYATASPLTHVHRSVPRTLLVHGTWDAAVPVHHSDALHAALRAVDAEVELVRVPFARHVFELIPESVATELSRQAVLRFLTG